MRRDVQHVAVKNRLLADLPIELRRLDCLCGRQIARNDRPQAVPGGDIGAAYHVIICCYFVCHDFFFCGLFILVSKEDPRMRGQLTCRHYTPGGV